MCCISFISAKYIYNKLGHIYIQFVQTAICLTFINKPLSKLQFPHLQSGSVTPTSRVIVWALDKTWIWSAQQRVWPIIISTHAFVSHPTCPFLARSEEGWGPFAITLLGLLLLHIKSLPHLLIPWSPSPCPINHPFLFLSSCFLLPGSLPCDIKTHQHLSSLGFKKKPQNSEVLSWS